ncbi:MAG: 50S ribosomal protein L23 [Candidatus Yanofskybacteria bacterium RIFCSPLOWO2_01_FULL_49_17]|uniref:Large ribosomal subunit protein uL23 n=1 Tax=Candidatus Yanofskybacteria bacterium RIFCSPLOWO2_01_FULL_49_17 TaxID=1802700 RepID=A0A1F8GRH3_9BACT|nr:MAG: 50S ribosomal protein L23 [Candidatus Yanofskybacteria bacterium RIFCSPLOWO2_01_FULL_49_17]
MTRTNLTVHIKRIYVSEKATRGKGLNQYVFEATSDANRPEIKKEVEKKYGVHVLRVNILNRKSKKVTVGRHEGRRPALRKAIVTLKEGESIPE